MILSITLWGTKNKEPNVKAFELYKRAGFDDITIEFQDNDLLLSDDFENHIKKLKNVLDSLDLKVSLTHLQCYPLGLGSSVIVPDIDKAILRSIEATAMLDCSWGVTHPRTCFDAIDDRKRNLNENIKYVEPLLRHAEKFNVGVAVENIPTWRDAPKNKYFSADFNELISLYDYFKSSPYIGVCWDTGHANLNMYGTDQYEAIRQIGKRLKAIHLASNDGTYDDHLMPPAFGTVDCKRLTDVFKEIGYDGVLSCELHSPELPETSETFAKLAHVCGQYILNLMK